MQKFEWIPCSEHIPEDNQLLLAAYLDDDGKYCAIKDVYSYSAQHRLILSMRQTLQIETISHWMPLPKPPDVETGMWIPKTERLPQEKQCVLVAYLNDSGVSCTSKKVCWYSTHCRCLISNRQMIQVEGISHWMPMPEPPTNPATP
jgi:hypothetical protein